MPTVDEIAQAIAPDAFANWQQEAQERGLCEQNPGYAVVAEHYEQRQRKARSAAERVQALLAEAPGH